jgi:hypothetical protein
VAIERCSTSGVVLSTDYQSTTPVNVQLSHYQSKSCNANKLQPE